MPLFVHRCLRRRLVYTSLTPIVLWLHSGSAKSKIKRPYETVPPLQSVLTLKLSSPESGSESVSVFLISPLCPSLLPFAILPVSCFPILQIPGTTRLCQPCSKSFTLLQVLHFIFPGTFYLLFPLCEMVLLDFHSFNTSLLYCFSERVQM